MPAAERYTNIAYLSVTESAANTLTFSKLETGIAPFEKRGWLISRLEYFVSVTSANWGADADALTYALTASNTISSLDLSDNAVIDYNKITRIDLGAAATGMFMERPIVKDLSTLAGGGVLVTPNPLYMAAVGTALTGATTVKCRMFYTSIDLKADEFWELVEMRRMVGT